MAARSMATRSTATSTTTASGSPTSTSASSSKPSIIPTRTTGTTSSVDGGQHLVPLPRDVMYLTGDPPK